ncbi:MAG: sugar phosphate isomerase/epimerase [Dehalococcoidia bacterium]|nr:sugar phosphate isomerase/epimerase [Dehalococcoidia bacterium]
MYVSLNGTLVAGGRLSWTEFAELAAKVGYPGVDVNLNAAMEQGLEATRSLLARLKLRPAVVGLPVDFRKDEAVFRQGLEKLPEAARFAATIGCPRMTTWVMSSSELPKSEQRKILKDRFGACAEILRREKVRLGLEFLGPLHLRRRFPHEFIYRMDEMLEFTKECGPNVGVLLDSWHWRHAGATVEDIHRAGKDGIVHVQVADAPAGVPPLSRRPRRRRWPPAAPRARLPTGRPGPVARGPSRRWAARVRQRRRRGPGPPRPGCR